MSDSHTLTIELDPHLLGEIDKLAVYESNGRRSVVKEAILRHVEAMTQMEDLKQLAVEQYLNNKLSFEQLARIVGYDYALEIREGKKLVEVSVADAKRDNPSHESNCGHK